MRAVPGTDNNDDELSLKTQALLLSYRRPEMDAKYDLLPAHGSFDVWSLGCVLYQMCNADVLPLFQGNQEDNMSEDASKEDCLHGLYEWSAARKQKKLNQVFDPIARNLLSELLQKNPLHRPSISRILQHPFISKQVR